MADVMKLLTLPLVIALAVAACSSSGPELSGAGGAETGAPDADARAVAISAANADWEPIAKATSPCGRYTLRLEHAEWRDEPGARPSLSLQFALRTGEADVLLCDGARVTDLVSSEGTEFREGDLDGRAWADSGSGMLVFHGLHVYRRDDRLRRLRVEARVLRVFSWTTYDVSCAGPGSRVDFVCAPYTVSLSGNAELPGICYVGACIREGWREFPAYRRDLVNVLGNDWVAASAALTDAHGRALAAHGGAGSGGFTSAMYGPDYVYDADPDQPPATIAWPVHGTIRLPERYVVEIVPFEFTDCPLAPLDAGDAR